MAAGRCGRRARDPAEGLKFTRLGQYGGVILGRSATDWSASTFIVLELKNTGAKAVELSLKCKGGGKNYTTEFRIGPGQSLVHREDLAKLRTRVDVSRITYLKLSGRPGPVQFSLRRITFEGGARAGGGRSRPPVGNWNSTATSRRWA